MENCYVIFNELDKEKVICHFDEIAYFKIRQFGELIIYNPVLKSGEIIFGDINESGKAQFEEYINYKNELLRFGHKCHCCK
jgi:hypothetical protein